MMGGGIARIALYIVAVVATGILMSGCAQQPVSVPDLVKPSAHLMRDPAPLPALREGEDAKEALIRTRGVCVARGQQVNGLRRWIAAQASKS